MVHACYLYDFYKNENAVIRHFNGFTADDYDQLQTLRRRLDAFMDPALSLGICVAVDAEQTYLQGAIDNISEQLEKKYNTNYQIIVMNTIQNYLKDAAARVDYEIEKARTYSRPIALKLVRGAYMVEEHKITRDSPESYPICESYEETSKMYNTNLEKLIGFRKDLFTKVDHSSTTHRLLWPHTTSGQLSISKSCLLDNNWMVSTSLSSMG
jgi:proline dehydrogenase